MILDAVYTFSQPCRGIQFIELPVFHPDENINHDEQYDTEDGDLANEQDYFDHSTKKYPPIRTTEVRRRWMVSPNYRTPSIIVDKDANLKSKISMLLQQTMHDTEANLNSLQKVKDKNRDRAPYKIGFILSMVKKSRDVLNELFTIAVKHRDEWKALEELKIFELIIHTNVDTTNLVRQLIELHIQHTNVDKTTEKSNVDVNENDMKEVEPPPPEPGNLTLRNRLLKRYNIMYSPIPSIDD